MKYSGGKSRSARRIAEVIRAERGRRGVLISPFVGGAAVETRLAGDFGQMLLCDLSPDLILLWQAVLGGWLPHPICEREYESLRDQAPSALRGFAGFGCTFGGKWFGGYGRNSPAQAHRNGGALTAAEQSVRVLARDQKRLSGTRVTARCCDYRDLSGDVMAGAGDVVVYADPPYFGTLGYAATRAFCHETFWQVMREWTALGALVFVSEETAPPDWTCVWSADVAGSMDRNDSRRVEKLFRHH